MASSKNRRLGALYKEMVGGSTRCFGTERRSMDVLWQDFFKDPSLWLDNRKVKTNERAPDFKHSVTMEALWIHSRHNPSWVEQELESRGILSLVPLPNSNDEELSGTGIVSGMVVAHREDIDLVASLKDCTRKKDLKTGGKLHAEILTKGLLQKSIYVGNHLVTMYAKCGDLIRAREVFNKISCRNVFSWNAMIAGYTQHGQGNEALDCFEQMQREGFNPDAVTFTCILKACGSIQAVKKGKQIHDMIIKEGLQEEDVMIGSALVGMYAKCGMLAKAREVFDVLPIRDAVSWNVLISCYAQQGQSDEALSCFEKMQHDGHTPDAFTFTAVLKACGSMKKFDMGKEIHLEIVKRNLLRKNAALGTALVDMYTKCGALSNAQEVLEQLPTRNAISWSALIAGYAQNEHGNQALKCFKQMQEEGFTPDAVTFASLLQACGSIGAVDKGNGLHVEIARKGLMQKDIVIGTALVDMYVKCGNLACAREVFDNLPVRSVVSWNTLIAGYSQQGHGEEALSCFENMQRGGHNPNAVTFVCVLKACGSIGAAIKGKEIHAQIVKARLLEDNLVVGNALVDMYSKCGMLAKAQEIFDKLPGRDVISWNALIAGYTQFGEDDMVFDLFGKMIGEGIEPNEVTFRKVLNACSHSGLADKGEMYFDMMGKRCGIIPDLEHYTCMVDLFGRASHFEKAMAVIKKMPSSDHLPVWNALLGACRKWGNVQLGRTAFERAVQLDERNAAPYVCMYNIYTAAGMHECAAEIEAMRVKIKARKIPGHSWWTDCDGIVHSFDVGDQKHPEIEKIYAKLEALIVKISQEGYSPGLHWVSKNLSDDEKKVSPCSHSEKMAIACALINSPEGTPIHVVKNLQICGDCHFATALISKIEKRRIEVRDANRFHIFEDGKCSCKDYW